MTLFLFLNTKHFYGAWATAYPGSPLFEFMQAKNMVTDTREYLLNIGSIGNYKYNFSELPIPVLVNKVVQLHQDVDIAYHYMNKQYLKAILKYTTKIFKNMISNIIKRIFFILGEKRKTDANKIEVFFFYFLKKIKIGTQKRSEKLSNIEVEKWLENLKAEEINSSRRNVFRQNTVTTHE